MLRPSWNGLPASAHVAVAALLIRVWVAATTGIIAEDSVHYVSLARGIEAGAWDRVLAGWTPPLHPLLLAIAHASTGDWVLGGKLLAVLSGTLTAVAVYFVAREAFGPRVALGAGLLAAAQPCLAELGGTLLSDSSALVFLSVSLWLGVRSAARRPLAGAFGSGMAAGLAYLCRPEGLLPAVVLAPWLFVRHLGGPGRRWVALAAPLALAAGVLLAGGPYMVYLSLDNGYPTLSRKKFEDEFSRFAWGEGKRWSERIEPERPDAVEAARIARLRASVDRRMAAEGASHYVDEKGRTAGPTVYNDPARHVAERRIVVWRSLLNAAEEIWEAAHPTIVVLVVVGLAAPGVDRRRRLAYGALFAIGIGLEFFILYRVHQEAGYISRRHAYGAVLLLLPWAGLGLASAPALLARLARSRPRLRAHADRVGPLFFVVVAATMLPKTLDPQSDRNLPERRAGEWIASVDPDPVVAGSGRVGFYAGTEAHQLPVEGGFDALVELLVSEEVEFVAINDRSQYLIAPLAGWGWFEEVHVEGEGKQRIVVYRPALPED